MFGESQMWSFNWREGEGLLPAAIQQISSHSTCTVRWNAVPFVKLYSLFGNCKYIKGIVTWHIKGGI